MTDFPPKMIERVARAAFDGDSSWWDRMHPEDQKDLMRDVVKVLSALTDDDLLALVAARWPGWRLVPRNPTDDMINGGYKWSKPRLIYQEMLAAAPSPKGGGDA